MRMIRQNCFNARACALVKRKQILRLNSFFVVLVCLAAGGFFRVFRTTLLGIFVFFNVLKLMFLPALFKQFFST